MHPIDLMNIVNVGYSSTNYYVLGQGRKRLLVDVGWPGTLPRLLGNLQRMDIHLPEIAYLLATHYHPDHAGLAQELQEQGVRLVVMEPQVPAVLVLKTYMKPEHNYRDIRLQDALRLALKDSRAFLKTIGIEGEVLSTPGHSDDSVTLVLDEGAAFTGDLPGLGWAHDEAAEAVARSWQAIQEKKAKTVYPGHGPVRPMEGV
jgi:endoribonuclease LACTB2